jgi:hypothetical protein
VPEHRESRKTLLPAALPQFVLPALAIIVALLALVRILGVGSRVAQSLDDTTLLYLAAAGGLFLARDIKSLAFGDYKVEFDRTRRIALRAQTVAEDAQAAAIGTGKSTGKRAAARDGTWSPQPGMVPSDPWKGSFGGKSEVAGRRLEASVERSADAANPFRLTLRVVSTEPRRNPLSGSVQFFLHDTFKNDRPIVTVGPDGAAQLVLRAYGAFTVGALADDGKTRLELDLATLQDAPEEFRVN